MTRRPDFDDLVGSNVDRSERERLMRVHELLLQAGPPPELSPEIEAGPTLAMTFGRAPRKRGRSIMLLAAALSLAAVVFLAGYVTGNDSKGQTGHTLSLVGTKAAPGALASLRVEPADAAGNWPMELSVTGLPKLPAHGYYTVYLTRDGKPWASCGTFVVAGKTRATSVGLNAPYHLQKGDGWVVTRQRPGQHDPGPVVLQPRV